MSRFDLIISIASSLSPSLKGSWAMFFTPKNHKKNPQKQNKKLRAAITIVLIHFNGINHEEIHKSIFDRSQQSTREDFLLNAHVEI